MKKKQPAVPDTARRSSFLNNLFLHISVIIIVTILIYSNTFHVPFQFDDVREIFGNPVIRHLNNFINPLTYQTRYVAYLTFAANYALHGINVVGYHIFNLAVHIVNALLVYWLVLVSFSTPAMKGSFLKDSAKPIAFFSSLLFAIHPVQVEAVTYIVQRLASLATLFYLFSIISYATARLSMQNDLPKIKSFQYYGLSLLSAVLAMKTKEISFTLPVVITLYEFIFFKTVIKKRILYLLPLVLTMLIIPLSLIHISKPLGDVIGDMHEITRLQTNMSRWDYLFTQFRVITTYIRLVFLPVNQNLYYDYPISRSFFSANVFFSFLFLLSVFILGIYLFYRYRKSAPHVTLISFGIFWFFATLSVESSIIPITDVIFEHRLYLPSIGFFIAIITFAIWLGSILKAAIPHAEKVIMSAFIIIAIVLAGLTIHRNAIWKDELTLWSDVVAKSPAEPLPHLNLGSAYWGKGLVDKAIEQYQIILARYPNYADAYHNMGVAFASKGWMAQAIEQYQTSLRLKPSANAYFSLGGAFFSQGLTEKAVEQYKAAVKLKPGFAKAYVNMGVAYNKLGAMDRAVECFETAIGIDPMLAEAYVNLGLAYEKLGAIDKVVEYLNTATHLDPTLAVAYAHLGFAYEKLGAIDKAIECLRMVVKLRPDYASAHYHLGKAYVALGATEEAMKQLQTTVTLQPDFAEAHKDYGVVLRSKGMVDDAIEQFQTAIRLKPDFAEAHRHLGDTYSEKGLLDLAIQQYQFLLRLDPRSAVVYYNLGVNLYNKGLTEKALEQFQKALRLQPGFAAAHNAVGTVYRKRGSIDKAIDHFQIAVKLQPDNKLFLNNLVKESEIKNQAGKVKKGAR